MANASVLAQSNNNATPVEGNGVAGPSSANINSDADKVMLPYAAVSGTLAADNKYATKTSAIRHSVAKTKTGATAASEVYSETVCFRTAYSGVEADSPALKEASGDDTRTEP